ncbi:serine protease [Streptomyces sp. WAC07061]|uniref:serine protease n=1 Tax=Streptomyces sp. WAC07061 TaxID=2487410 RepID=UPI000F79619A|nr:serine protease [Streptomyces sp. WAC07061]RSS61730.1 serine protease [Streptomyces sp. WAC07061]
MGWVRKLAAAVVGAVAVAASAGGTPAQAIVGGNEASAGQYPYMAGLLLTNDRSLMCGGTLISDQWVLTAAHCVTWGSSPMPAPELTVLLGTVDRVTPEPTGKFYTVRTITIHRSFDSKVLANDIALVELTQKVQQSSYIQPVQLAPGTLSTQNLAGRELTATGWGTHEFGGPQSRRLHRVRLDAITNSACQAGAPRDKITSNQICTQDQGKGICQFDAGGPLTYPDPYTSTPRLAAVISHTGACGEAPPVINTFVPPYLTWIQDTIRQATATS